MPNKINNLTTDEIEEHLTGNSKERACKYCGKHAGMRPNQLFCCSAHRSAYANNKMKQELINLRNRVAELEEKLHEQAR